MKIRIAAAALAAALLLSAGPGSARPASEPAAGNAFSISVRHHDLDLGSEKGRAVLDRRLRAAAWAGCRKLYRGDASMIMVMGCAGAAIAEARPEADRAIALSGGGGRRIALGAKR